MGGSDISHSLKGGVKKAGLRVLGEPWRLLSGEQADAPQGCEWGRKLGKEEWREGDTYGRAQRLYFWMNVPRTSSVLGRTLFDPQVPGPKEFSRQTEG